MSVNYLAMMLKKDIVVEAFGNEYTLPFDFADGLIGMVPVFDTIENAKKYAGDGKEIITVKIKDKK